MKAFFIFPDLQPFVFSQDASPEKRPASPSKEKEIDPDVGRPEQVWAFLFFSSLFIYSFLSFFLMAFIQGFTGFYSL